MSIDLILSFASRVEGVQEKLVETITDIVNTVPDNAAAEVAQQLPGVHIAWWQILLITLYSAYQILDELTICTSAGQPVFAGFVTGIIMGNPTTGLLIGGAAQLFILGVGTFGGASRIDATSGAILATAFSVAGGIDTDLALTLIAVPVAALLVNTDVLGRFLTTFFAHRIDAAIERFDYKSIERNYLLGALPWAASRAIPVCLALSLGAGPVTELTKYINENIQWLADGLTLAGKMLPGVGFAILLHYLPLKKNVHYLGLGFALTVILGTLFGYTADINAGVAKLYSVPVVNAVVNAGVEKGSEYSYAVSTNSLPMIGIAVIGFAFAAMSYQNSLNKQVVKSTGNSESGEVEDDEI